MQHVDRLWFDHDNSSRDKRANQLPFSIGNRRRTFPEPGLSQQRDFGIAVRIGVESSKWSRHYRANVELVCDECPVLCRRHDLGTFPWKR